MTRPELEPDYRALFERTPAQLLAFRPDAPRYTVVAVSDGLARAMAAKREKILGRSLLEVFPFDRANPGTAGDVPAWLERVTRTRSVDGSTLQRRGEGGGARAWRLTSAPVVGPSGEVELVVCAVEEVTTVEPAELHEGAGERFLELDALARLFHVSSLFLGGRDLNELLGQLLDAAMAATGADFGNVQVLDPRTSSLEIAVHRGFSASWLAHRRRAGTTHAACAALASRARVIVEDVTSSPIFARTEELEIQLKEGVRAVVSTPLIAQSGEPVGTISTHFRAPRRPPDQALALLDLVARRAADLIERARIETSLRRSEAKATAILMTSIEAIICIDRGRRITEWSLGAETIFGYPREEALGAQLDMLIPERYLAAHREHVANFALEAKPGRQMDHETAVGRRKNGEEFPITAKISKLVLDDELIMTVSVRDVTEERRIMDDLRRAIAARDEILGVVAHDLRNPLHTILDVSRLEGDHLSVEREVVPTRQMLAEVLELQRALVTSRSLELRVELSPGIPDVWVDKQRVYQVFENLIGNAAKFTKSGSITIGAKPQAGEVLFWVADTGAGIPPDQLPHLFERFWQTPKATRRGAGLGLAIVKGIVEAHGGRIWVESQVEKGTTFFFLLPIARPAEAGQTPVVPPIGPTSTAPHPTTVLLAEDDPDVRESLAEALWRDGYQVIAVANGAEALEQMRREPRPASVVLDLMMPVVDGWAFLAERSRDPRLLEVPVIVISAQPDVEERVAQAHARHLEKPVLVDRLLAMLKDPAAQDRAGDGT